MKNSHIYTKNLEYVSERNFGLKLSVRYRYDTAFLKKIAVIPDTEKFYRGPYRGSRIAVVNMTDALHETPCTFFLTTVLVCHYGRTWQISFLSSIAAWCIRNSAIQIKFHLDLLSFLVAVAGFRKANGRDG